MKRVVGALFILSAVVDGETASAQSAERAPPPTAQFPAEPGPAAAPGATAALPPAPAPPLTAPPAPPPGAAPPPAYPAYPYPPPYPYAPPLLVPLKPPASDSEEVVSLTLSPLLLILPIVQLTGEVRVTPHLGISLIAGYGSLSVDNPDTESFKVSAYELGTRVVGYPLKKFKSLQLGAQLMYLKVDTGGPVTSSNVSGTAAGVAFGPFAGYKLITDAGFTFVANLGFQYLAAQAQAQDNAGNSSSASDSRFLPLLNLEIGWSF
jgi:hypothetical protein